MHDLTYANQILDKLKSKIRGKDKSVNVAIDVYLSPFSHVAPERLKDVFDLLAGEEGFTNTTLNVNIAEFCVHCKKCGQTWKSAKPTFKCPECDSADFELEKWEEFYIDSIEVKG
ncbi:MAG: hydrogenase maturation nickel metallochaperone HypA [Candidatus Omnitrophica bacterium]|nr:hydrogenase maturation nickel metallochaperone HypA [Candidatus Omnitrophota bacterium]